MDMSVFVCYLSRRTHRVLLSFQVELLPILEAHSEVLLCLSHKKSFCFCLFGFFFWLLCCNRYWMEQKSAYCRIGS